jgi:hypothetical protein
MSKCISDYLKVAFISVLAIMNSIGFSAFPSNSNCPRKIEVMAYGYKDAPPGTIGKLGKLTYQKRWIDDNTFNLVVFLKEFQGLFRSDRLLLNIKDHPEYSLTATFSKTSNLETGQPMSCLTIVLAFNGGRVCNDGLSYSWIDERFPCAYHYYVLLKWTSQAPGHDISAHVPLMASQINIGEIENKMTAFEQIPISAEFEKEPEWCDEEKLKLQSHGKLTINIVKFKAEAPPVEGSTHQVRIVVRAQKGTITNGDFIIADPFAKVFTISPQDVGGSARVIVYYQPPDGEDKSDIITVFNSCDVYYTSEVPLNQTTIGSILQEVVKVCNVHGYSGTITITKSWDYTNHHDDYSSTHIGNQTVTVSGIFKPISQMEGMEGQPIKIFGKGTSHGTWRYNERRYCEGKGCGDCKGLVYEEYGSGSISSMTMDGVMIITNVWPTENKTVADQLKQFGMENFYDIMIPSETVETQNRIRSDTRDAGCQWNNSNTTNVLTECSVRYKLKDIELLQGRESWSSKSETTAISVTNLIDAIYEQKPYDPEQNGNDYTYSITWNLKAF